MGQPREAKSGGTQGFQDQTQVQNVVCGRRGVVRNQGGGLGPTGLVRKPPPSGGGGGSVAETEQILPCRCLWGKVGPTQKFAKIK